MRFNEDALKKMHSSRYAHPELSRSQLSNDFSRDSSSSELQSSSKPLSLDISAKDLEMPMPPWALAPLKQNGIRYVLSFHDILSLIT